MTTRSHENNKPDEDAPKIYKDLPRRDKKKMKLEDAAEHSSGKEGLKIQEEIEKEAAADD